MSSAYALFMVILILSEVVGPSLWLSVIAMVLLAVSCVLRLRSIRRSDRGVSDAVALDERDEL